MLYSSLNVDLPLLRLRDGLDCLVKSDRDTPESQDSKYLLESPLLQCIRSPYWYRRLRIRFYQHNMLFPAFDLRIVSDAFRFCPSQVLPDLLNYLLCPINAGDLELYETRRRIEA